VKRQYRKAALSSLNRERLDTVNGIIEEYVELGYRLTLRQLYYQLVSRDIIPNSDKEYKKLGNLLVEGRMGGVVDWDAIEDRVRQPYIPYWVHDIAHALQDTKDQYRLDRQRNQENYIELWVEKDALSNVLKRITTHYHIFLCVNRGYSSCSAMYDSAIRIHKSAGRRHKRPQYILYLGDHDPSGLDMVRDIGARLGEFNVHPEIRHIALTDTQIEAYSPPPNPAKISDPRAAAYIKKYGDTSWEVDALRPEVLSELVNAAIEELMDMEGFEEVLSQEEIDREFLSNLADERGQ